MDYITCLLLLSFVWTCIRLLRRKSDSTTKLPPGPYPFPIIGSLFKLGHLPHQSLANLSKLHGPLMSLKLGSITTIVASSPKFAKEILHKHDHVFSSRTVPDAAYALEHHNHSLAFLPVEPKWRNLRRICREQLFSTQRLDSSQGLRRKKVQDLLDHVCERGIGGEAVDIGGAAFTTTLNFLSNTFFSIDFAHYHSHSSQDFKEIVWAILESVGKPNLADYFPVLKLIDPLGIRRQTTINTAKLMAILDGIIDERLQSRASNRNDVLETLLDLSQEDDTEFSSKCTDLKHLLLDLFVAGTHTSSTTIEWAMAELLRNPKKLAKARTELEEVIGKDGPVQESDISKLPYLKAVVKETLRLHPPAPFLLPHKADADVEVDDGFVVPKNAQILVNVWATGRDSSVWLNPLSFMPERFLDCEIDFRGQDLELIPFGAGRRICPGLPLADRMVHLMLGSLLHSFDWKLEDETKAEDIDMSEKFGLALQKAIPLKAMPIRL